MDNNQEEDRGNKRVHTDEGDLDMHKTEDFMFLQATYPYPVCNHTSREVDSCNIGYAQGILKDGVPFEAELWKDVDNKLVALSIYLPELKEMYEEYNKIENTYDLEEDNIIAFEKTDEIDWQAVLCIGMVERDSNVDDEELHNYVEYLIQMGVIAFDSDFLNGNLHYLTDIEGNDLVSVEIILEEDGCVWAKTPLQFIDFPSNPKKHRFKVVK